MPDRSTTRTLCVLASLGLGAALTAQPAPRTVPEESEHGRTSTHDEVSAFVDAVLEMPGAGRLRAGTLGVTNEGREILTVTAAVPVLAETRADAAGDRLRILINANIHGGEVEGKEACLMLLREIATGAHDALLRDAVLLFVPDFNADGNDALAANQRRGQNGPRQIGRRANAQGLDLNRDFVKAESPEVRGLLGAIKAFDPHLFIDLHTTNGSHHGYHLTYAPSLSANVDAELDGFARQDFLPAVTEALQEQDGFRAFHYGNFGRGETKSWSTYDHRPRFGTNYYGLRNRLALLSEAYAYLDFATRIAVTRAFVLRAVGVAVETADRIRSLCAAADRRLLDGDEIAFGFDTVLGAPRDAEVLVGSVERVTGDDGSLRLVAHDTVTAERMAVRDHFVARQHRPLPEGWLLVAPTAAARMALELHGLDFEELADARTLECEVFVTEELVRARRAFQGHHELSVRGTWVRRTQDCPEGSLWVPARQRLGRLAAQLLEPESEDGLLTWGALDTGDEAPALPLRVRSR